MIDTEVARLILSSLGSVDTMEAQVALLADTLRRQREAWIAPLKTPEEHASALAQIEKLAALDPTADSDSGWQLQALVALVAHYEAKHHPIVSDADKPALYAERAAWEALMIWARERGGTISPADDWPVLVAEWMVKPEGSDDGARALCAGGQTYGAASVALAKGLGIL